MKLMTTTALIIALTAGVSMAQEATETTPKDIIEVVEPTVSFADAVTIVDGATTGKITAMELDYPFGGPAYVADVTSETNETVLVVDGLTGEVLADATFKVARPELMEDFMMNTVLGPLMHDAAAIADFEDFADLCPGDEVPEDLMEALAELNPEQLEDAIASLRAADCDVDWDELDEELSDDNIAQD